MRASQPRTRAYARAHAQTRMQTRTSNTAATTLCGTMTPDQQRETQPHTPRTAKTRGFGLVECGLGLGRGVRGQRA
eukprot:3829339-Rhodomonas_salina.1